MKAHVIADHFKDTPSVAQSELQRKMDVLILTCPFDTSSDFLELLVLSLVQSWRQRGFPVAASLRLVLNHLFGKQFAIADTIADPPPGANPDSIGDEEVRIQEICTPQYIAKHLAQCEMVQLIQLLKQRYMEDSVGDATDSVPYSA